MDDTHIIELLFKRDEQALKAVEKKFGGLCFSIAFNILHNRPDAEECVNDAYFALWNSIPPERPQNFSAYIAKITRNKALDRYERENSKKRGGSEYEQVLSELAEEIASDSKTDEFFNQNFLADVINKYLCGISENKAAIFIQRYYMCYDIDEIAENMGRTYNSVVVALSRMRKELRKMLEKEGIDL